eukprot:922944-Amphidinium_carterae.1
MAPGALDGLPRGLVQESRVSLQCPAILEFCSDIASPRPLAEKKKIVNIYEYTFEPLGEMTQRNMETNNVRRIRRVVLLG